MSEPTAPLREAGYALDVRVLTEVMGWQFDGTVYRGPVHSDGYRLAFGNRPDRIVPPDDPDRNPDHPYFYANERDGVTTFWRTMRSLDACLEGFKLQFSRDDAAAMRVVDEMVGRRFKFIYYEYVATDTEAVTCLAQFQKGFGGPLGEARHPDRRVAICLAALAAVEQEGANGRPS